MEDHRCRAGGPVSVAQGPRMSVASAHSDERSRLREELRELREEVRRLTARVDRQSDLIAELSSKVEEKEEESFKSSRDSFPFLPEARGAESESRGSYSLVGVSQAPQSVPEGAGPSWSFRVEVAKGIGAFLKQAVQGNFRGNSGRRRLDLASHFYIVCKDKSGRIHTDPVLAVSRFSKVKELCFTKGACGDTVFVGVPTIEEGKIAVAEAGFLWPSQLQQ